MLSYTNVYLATNKFTCNYINPQENLSPPVPPSPPLDTWAFPPTLPTLLHITL